MARGAGGWSRSLGASRSGYASGRSAPSEGARSSGRGGSSPAQRAVNTRMWSEPATGKQVATLKAHGNYDGKYYSKGRAGQAIGQSVRRQTSAAAPSRSAISAWNAPAVADGGDRTLVRQPAALDTSEPPVRDINDAAVAAPSDHINVSEEGTLMSQLTLASPRDVTTVVELSTSAPESAVPFDFVAELERKHLASVAATVTAGDARQVHAMEKGWAIAKVTMITTFARATNEIVSILHGAPSGTIASYEATAREILWSSCSAELEQSLLEAAHRAKGKPSQVLDLLLAEVSHRVEVAKIYAHGRVDLAAIQAALPPRPSKGYEPAWGEVTGVRHFGAFIRLASGESGLMHVSEMRALNGGRIVEDPETVLNVGQTVYVRVTGLNDEGKPNFAPAKEA